MADERTDRELPGPPAVPAFLVPTLVDPDDPDDRDYDRFVSEHRPTLSPLAQRPLAPEAPGAARSSAPVGPPPVPAGPYAAVTASVADTTNGSTATEAAPRRRYPPPGWPRPPQALAVEAAMAAFALASGGRPSGAGALVAEVAVAEAVIAEAEAAALGAERAEARTPRAVAGIAVTGVSEEPPSSNRPVAVPVISRGERLLLLAVAAGGLLAPLNFAMLAVALPDIRSEFGVSHAATAWLLSSYLITMTVAQPIAGSLGDQLGRARVLRMALLVFLICSLAATIAPSFPLLVALRVGQAASGATLIPTGMAMLRAVVPTERLGRMFGTFDAMLGIAAASGPLIGAFLVEVLSWRLLFLINVPIVLLALWLLMLVKYRDSQPTSRLQIDWIGGTLLAGILAGFTWLFGSFDSEENQALVVAVAVGMVVLALGFVRRQTSGGAAMVPWGLFRLRSFAAAGAYVLMSNLVLYTALLTIPFFIREVQDGSPTRIGLVLGALSIQLAVMAPLSGWLSDRRGRRMPAVAGAMLVVAGMLMLAIGLSPDSPFPYLAIALALVGSGVGLGIGPATTAAIEIAPRALAGAVSGTDLMMSYVGSIVGTGVVAAVLGSSGAVHDTDVFRTVFVVAAVIATLTMIAGLAIHGRLAEDLDVA